jgi:hypothetical protein
MAEPTDDGLIPATPFAAAAEPAASPESAASGHPADDGLPGFERLEIDGVPVFHLPDARRPTIALQFRVGRSDEPFPRMGITHVVEHLALFKLGRRRHPANGFVDNIRTVFHASGTEDELVDYVHGVVAGLTDLPLDRLADEARILRTEALHRAASLWEQLAWYRYGSVGPGAIGLVEYGLNDLPSEAVVAWSRDWFTRGNAVVWIAGPIPAGLRLALPDGPRRPIPPAIPIADLPLPAWTAIRVPGIALGLHTPRTFDATIAGRILTKRLETHLRYELGRSYEVSIAYQPLDADEALSSIFASCLDEDAEKVRAAFLATVDQLARSGPTDEELAEDRVSFDRAMDDPDAGYGELERAAHCDLTGHPFATTAQLRAEMLTATPGSVRDALRSALDSAILMGPLDAAPTGLSARQWHNYPAWSTTWVQGERLDRSDRKYPWSKRTEELIVGREGVTWIDQAQRGVTVRYADLVGMVIDSDGARMLHGRDGFRVRVRAADWDHGVQAVAAIDSAVPPELVVRMAAT